jgi:hypothetical protein
MGQGRVFVAGIGQKSKLQQLQFAPKSLAWQNVPPGGVWPHCCLANLCRRHLADWQWGKAFKQLCEQKGARLGQGARNDKTSATVAEVAKEIGIPTRTAERRVKAAETFESLPDDLKEVVKADRATKAWRLAKLGWTQAEIATLFGVDQRTISLDTKNCHLAKIGNDLGPDWNEHGIAEVAEISASLWHCRCCMSGPQTLNRCE